MLTNLHYYGHYRRYASQPARVRHAPRTADWVTFGRKSAVDVRMPQETSVQLNAAYKSETINYARNLTRNVVGLKDSAKMFVYDAAGQAFGDDSWQWIEEDIENFVSAYNGLRKIAAHQGHSLLLTDFTASMDSYTRLNREKILKLGLKINRERNLEFAGQVPKQLRGQDMRTSLDSVSEFFKQSYRNTASLLEHPLTKHMNFRSLSFYYNYRFGPSGENAFTLMENGILLDVAV